MPNRYHPDAPDWMIESAREYIAATTWTFAKTMADIPHWYTVRQRAQRAGLGTLHERLYLLIRDYHYIRRWRGGSYRSIDLDGYLYWIMQNGTVINRKPHDVES
ncbi:hypothetical protein [Agromyces silvae]|uniref:hypothetical protein n=1 Tax=Agromyces silvae TaxID=3388266 RepID=UPI00280AAAFE|nr:hypothetical protein [Agromyces protaetiae]